MIWNNLWNVSMMWWYWWNFTFGWWIITHEFKNRTIISWTNVWIITMIIPIPISTIFQIDSKTIKFWKRNYPVEFFFQFQFSQKMYVHNSRANVTFPNYYQNYNFPKEKKWFDGRSNVSKSEKFKKYLTLTSNDHNR